MADDLREALLKHADVVKIISSYLSVQKSGKDYLSLCPFHDDSRPSMHISPEKQMFKCFVCGTGGDAISFVSKYTRISYREAMKKVADLVGFDDPRLHEFTVKKNVDSKKESLLKCTHDLTVYYQYALNTQEGQDGLSYFEGRHLDESSRKKYLLGYAPKDGKATIDFLLRKGHSVKTIEDIGISSIFDGGMSDNNKGRAIFPICDDEGNVIGFSARRIVDNDEAKYINSPETYLFHKSNVLYNYHIAKEKARIAGCIYVLEGFMDVFALSRVGIDNAVAIMGTALSNEHIEMLRKLNVEIRLCLDGDLPGQSAMMKISKKLQEANLKFVIVDNQNSSKDPDEILNTEGEEALRSYLNKTLSRTDFALEYYKNSNPLSTSEQKRQLILEFIPILAQLSNMLELDSYIKKLAVVTGYEPDSIKQLLKRTRAKSEQRDEVKRIMDKTFKPEHKLLRRLEFAEREMLYQMVNNPEAAKFYQEKVGSFYIDIYRKVANYVMNYYEENPEYNVNALLGAIQENDDDNSDVVNQITELCFEPTHPQDCDDKLLNNLLDTIEQERDRINEEDTLKQSMEGKSELEKARILAERNRRIKRKKEEAK